MDTLFQELVDGFYADVYRFALSLARNPDDACELTQQVYAKAAARIHQLREPSKAKSWLFTALYREFLKSKARANRLPLAEEEEIAKLEDPNGGGGAQQAAHEELREALLKLEESQRAVLSLFYMDQVSYKEISAILDIPIGTVMSRLARAKEVLREVLDPGNKTLSHGSNHQNQK
ncbi:MAG: sigma-70 family RNA polymerase sigma factor [Terrimicrobiaceae bacterium]